MPWKIPSFKPPRLKAITDADAVRPSAHDRGYCGLGWRRIREQVLVRDAYQCALCGRIADGYKEAHVDHIVPRASGGTDDLANLRVLCQSCHSTRTAKDHWGSGRSSGRAHEAKQRSGSEPIQPRAI